MDMNKLLSDEIQSEFKKMEVMKVGTEEYKTTVDGLTKLVDRAIEIEKLNVEHENTIEQMNEDKRDRYIKNGISVAGILIPSVITIWGTIKSLRFEQEGTVTTIMGRGFINKLLPKK